MPLTIIDRDKMHPTAHNGRRVEDGSLRTSLRQGTELGTADIPELAKGRPAGSKPQVSFALAGACIKLVMRSEVASARFVGPDGASTPSGVIIKTKDKGLEITTALKKSADGKKGTLEIRGNQFGTSMFSYYGGIAVASWMMMNHQTYKDFTDATKETIAAFAGSDQTRMDRALAWMSDEIAFAMERMMDGSDPLGVTEIDSDQLPPTDLIQEFKGGDLVPKAFVDTAGLDTLKNTKIQATTIASVIIGNDVIDTEYVGNLPYELKDYFLTGWHVLMTGPTATGKTSAVNSVALHLSTPYVLTAGNDGKEDRDLIGSWVPDGTGGLRFSYGPISEAMMHAAAQEKLQEAENARAKAAGETPAQLPPVILFVDEINRFRQRQMGVLIEVMNEHPDGKGGYYHRYQIPETNEILTCPVGRLVVVAARNFGGSYVVEDMDHALIRRFPAKLDIGYLEPKEETKLVVKKSGLDEKTAKVLTRVAADTRTHQRAQLKAPLDPGTLILWAKRLKDLKDRGVQITDKVVLETARKIVFEAVVDRTEIGDLDPAGETILTDNINESWKEVMKK